jgi:hypothetical protein
MTMGLDSGLWSKNPNHEKIDLGEKLYLHLHSYLWMKI